MVAKSEELFFDGGQGLGFGGTTILVELVELFGESLGADGVAGEEELYDVTGDIHAARGVDTGCEAKGNFGGSGGAVEGELGDVHKGAEAGLDGVAELAEAEPGDGSVFTVEGHGVGDCGDGYELEERGEDDGAETGAGDGGVGLRLGVGGEEGVRELEGDGGSAEALVRVRAVGLGWVDDGKGFGDAGDLVGEVVVGDDEVEGRGLWLHRRRSEGADAGVDTDDETDARGCGEAEDVRLHAIAFADAMGDVVGDLGGTAGRRDALDGGLEEDGGGGAVDVVVAVDEDGLAGVDGLLDAGDGFTHAEEKEGVVEGVEGGGEEGGCSGGIGDAAG